MRRGEHKLCVCVCVCAVMVTEGGESEPVDLPGISPLRNLQNSQKFGEDSSAFLFQTNLKSSAQGQALPSTYVHSCMYNIRFPVGSRRKLD